MNSGVGVDVGCSTTASEPSDTQGGKLPAAVAQPPIERADTIIIEAKALDMSIPFILGVVYISPDHLLLNSATS